MEWDTDELKHFPKPPWDAPLWKYFRPEHFEDFIKTGELYFRQVGAFEDEAEGLMNKHQIQAVQAHYKDAPNMVASMQAMHESIRRSSWVCCLTAHPDEQRHMFRDYCGRNGNGVAILTSFRRFEIAHAPYAERCRRAHVIVEGALVRYQEASDFASKVGYLLFQKLVKYQPEAEFRLCVCVPGYTYHHPDSRDHIRVPVVVEHLIKRIVVHPDAGADYFERVCSLADAFLPQGRKLVSWSRLPIA